MKVGILGYGSLGKYLVDFIVKNGDKYNLQLNFVWNRSCKKLKELESCYVLEDISKISSRNVDLIIEVAHPEVVQQYGIFFLSFANLFIGSPTALADDDFEKKLRKACVQYKRSVYIPSGAFWGAQDIQKMASLNTLNELTVTMKKHPSAFRVLGELKNKNDQLINSSSKESVVLYNGPVRDLCPLAPNNVNTMAAAAIAACNLGFDKVRGCLIADPSMVNWHVIEIHVKGIPRKDGLAFETTTIRRNPANFGAVTGSATYGSFCNSLLQAQNQHGIGFHMC